MKTKAVQFIQIHARYCILHRLEENLLKHILIEKNINCYRLQSVNHQKLHGDD